MTEPVQPIYHFPIYPSIKIVSIWLPVAGFNSGESFWQVVFYL